MKDGMTCDEESTQWWGRQSHAAREEALGGPQDERFDPKDALTAFRRWIKSSPTSEVWAQGPTFDIVLLENAFRRYDIEIPWKFYEVRDARTLTSITGIYKRHHQQLVEKEKVKVAKIIIAPNVQNMEAHHALYDCWVQILAVSEACRHLVKRK